MSDSSNLSSVNRERLYGPNGAEELWFDVDEAISTYLDGWLADEIAVGDVVCFPIEEWSTHPPQYHMPSAERLLEWIGEQIDDSGEWGEYVESWDVPLGDAEVKAAAQSLLDLLASKVKVRMANQLLRTLTVDATLQEDATWTWEKHEAVDA